MQDELLTIFAGRRLDVARPAEFRLVFVAEILEELIEHHLNDERWPDFYLVWTNSPTSDILLMESSFLLSTGFKDGDDENGWREELFCTLTYNATPKLADIAQKDTSLDSLNEDATETDPDRVFLALREHLDFLAFANETPVKVRVQQGSLF